jgi:hypothetical protein
MHLVILVRTESLEEGDVNFVLLQASLPYGQGCDNLAVVDSCLQLLSHVAGNG